MINQRKYDKFGGDALFARKFELSRRGVAVPRSWRGSLLTLMAKENKMLAKLT